MSGRSRELLTTVLLVSRIDPSGLLCGQIDKAPIARLDNFRRGRSQSPRRASALQLHPCIRCVLHTEAGVRQSAIDRAQGRSPMGCQYGLLRYSYTACIVLSETYLPMPGDKNNLAGANRTTWDRVVPYCIFTPARASRTQ